MLGGGQAFCFGVCMVVKKKFSASNFWKDCIKYKVTVRKTLGYLDTFRLLMLLNQKAVGTASKETIQI